MKKLNERSKAEQFFIIMLMFVAFAGIFCLTGCGGCSCETPQCANEDIDVDGVDGKLVGCSIPGCGGCLSSGRGCNTACYPQAIKCVSVSLKSEDGEDELKMNGCDTRYFGTSCSACSGCSGCGGCGDAEKTCYSGCVTSKSSDGDNVNGFFYGSEEGGEKFIGCSNGCGGCVASDYDFFSTMYIFESEAGIE